MQLSGLHIGVTLAHLCCCQPAELRHDQSAYLNSTELNKLGALWSLRQFKLKLNWFWKCSEFLTWTHSMKFAALSWVELDVVITPLELMRATLPIWKRHAHFSYQDACVSLQYDLVLVEHSAVGQMRVARVAVATALQSWRFLARLCVFAGEIAVSLWTWRNQVTGGSFPNPS